MTGQGVAGIVVGLIRIITKAAYNDSPAGINTSTLIYFILAAFVEVCCIVAYFVLINLTFSRFHLGKKDASRGSNSVNEGGSASEKASLLDNNNGAAPTPRFGVVLKKVFLLGFTVWSVFFVTLSLFPGLLTLIPAFPGDPNNSNKTWGGWFVVINVFIFQVFDFVGRMLPRWFVLIRPRVLWIFTTSRVIFAALFVLCIVPEGHPVFASNWAAYVIMAVFAITNGYGGTLAMMFGPDQVDLHEKSLAGMIMSAFLQFGIFSAVLFALFILYLLNPCGLPPFLMTSQVYNACNMSVACIEKNVTASLTTFF